MEQAGIYTVAAIERPTELEAQGGKTARTIFKVDVTANGRSSAIAQAVLEHADKLKAAKFEPQRTDWIVKRFVGDNA